MWALDVSRSTLVDVSGSTRREITIERDSLAPASLISFKGAGINQAPPWFESIPGGFLLARDRTSRRESALQAWSADILLLDEEGRLSLYSPIADFVGDPSARFGTATRLLPYPVWAVCGDGTVGLYDPLINALRRVTPTGEELDVHPLPEERGVEITVDRVFEMFYRQMQAGRPAGQLPPKEEVRRLTQEQNEELVNHSAHVFPEYADLHCTADDFWIRPFDPDAELLGQGSEWIRIPTDGTPTRIVLPHDFKTFRIEDDRIWGTIRGSLGVESVAWVELSFPSPG